MDYPANSKEHDLLVEGGHEGWCGHLDGTTDEVFEVLLLVGEFEGVVHAFGDKDEKGKCLAIGALVDHQLVNTLLECFQSSELDLALPIHHQALISAWKNSISALSNNHEDYCALGLKQIRVLHNSRNQGQGYNCEILLGGKQNMILTDEEDILDGVVVEEEKMLL